ncbi:MAG: hypothetical protein RR795_08865 [Cetobacterium sp.]|uniref:hypothetical protein n=1 Tax=Cetobacterium sp. TaxID=2071632 RepID=UPI002FC685F3
MNSIYKTQNSQELIKESFRENVAEFGKNSDYLFQDLKGKINRYFMGILSLNIFCGIIFLIGVYFFQYREIREDIGSIKRILIGDEKYWWDRDNKILFLQRDGFKK